MGLFSSVGNFLGNNADWIGPAIGVGGALFGGDSLNPASSRTTTGSTTSSPWVGAQPMINGAMQDVNDAYSSGAGQTYYPGQTYTPMGSDTSTGLNQMRDRAMNGSELNNQANTSLTNMINGETNPHLDSMVDTAMDRVGDHVNSAFSKAGRYGSGDNPEDTAHGRQLTRSMGEVANNMYGSQYNNDQSRRLAGISMAGSVAENDYTDAGKLLGIGETVEGYQDQQVQDNMNRWNFSQNQPLNLANQYADQARLFGGLGGGTTSTGTSPANSPTQNFGDWAAIGQDVGNAFSSFGNPTPNSQPSNTFSSGLVGSQWQNNPYQNPWTQ